MVVDLGIATPLDLVFRGYESQNDWPAIARMLDEHIRVQSDVLPLVRHTWQLAGRVSFQAAEAKTTIDRDQLGRQLEGTIESGLALLKLLDSWRRRAEEHGQVIEGAKSLTAMIEDVDRIRSEALDNWPWTPSKEEWAEAAAEFERGESVDVDDAFAAASGMTRDEWSRRVQERRQALAGEDGQ